LLETNIMALSRSFNMPEEPEAVEETQDSSSGVSGRIRSSMISSLTEGESWEDVRRRTVQEHGDAGRCAVTENRGLEALAGLLGYVYFDPSVRDSCAESKEFLEGSAVASRFCSKISSLFRCRTCSYNAGPRCDLFQKEFLKSPSDITAREAHDRLHQLVKSGILSVEEMTKRAKGSAREGEKPWEVLARVYRSLSAEELDESIPDTQEEVPDMEIGLGSMSVDVHPQEDGFVTAEVEAGSHFNDESGGVIRSMENVQPVPEVDEVSIDPGRMTVDVRPPAPEDVPEVGLGRMAVDLQPLPDSEAESQIEIGSHRQADVEVVESKERCSVEVHGGLRIPKGDEQPPGE